MKGLGADHILDSGKAGWAANVSEVIGSQGVQVFLDSIGDLASEAFPLLSHGVLVQHLANRSTYHRGQLALMMRQRDAEPLATDFHVFLVEGRREAAADPANQGNLSI